VAGHCENEKAQKESKIEMLKEGDRAPEFRLLADDGLEVALSNYAGKNVIFYFFPKALTPG
jgi:peroxiredoxin Q/BCP